MRKKSAAEKNITPAITCTAPWRLVSVKPLANYCLEVEFVDGLKGVIEMSQLILGLDAGVFGVLKDHGLFSQVGLVYGAVSWPNELDLAPDAMYTDIKEKGRCILK